jgi:hypothetical protein
MKLLERNKHHHWVEQEIMRLLSMKLAMLGSTPWDLEEIFFSATRM